jgi:hypothetical protein
MFVALLGALTAFVPNVQDLSVVEKYVRVATFVFVGTVQNRGETGSNVRVDDVVDGNDFGKSLRGRSVTVQAKTGGAWKEGEQRVFFTKAASYSKSVSLTLVGDMSTSQGKELGLTADTGPKTILGIRVAERMKTAAYVVVGTVARVSEPQLRKTKVTEHDPEWRMASVSVKSVLKGKAAERLTVYFPSSRDILWFRSPRLREGQSVLLILHANDALFLPKGSLTALHRLDVRDADDAKWVASLLEKNR